MRMHGIAKNDQVAGLMTKVSLRFCAWSGAQTKTTWITRHRKGKRKNPNDASSSNTMTKQSITQPEYLESKVSVYDAISALLRLASLLAISRSDKDA